jgi:hypothetical protein
MRRAGQLTFAGSILRCPVLPRECVRIHDGGNSRDLHSGSFLSRYDGRRYYGLVRARGGQLAEAGRELAAYLGTRRNTPAADWISEIGRFLLDHISESDFLEDATSSDLEKDRAQHCKHGTTSE